MRIREILTKPHPVRISGVSSIKGQSLICLDYAQLELRVATLFHQDPAMTRILCDPKGDLHTHTAKEFAVDRDPTAKQINFLLVYGGGAYMLGKKLTTEGVTTSQEAAYTLIQTYDHVYAKVRPWRKALLEEHRENGFIRLWTKRKRALLDIDWDDKNSVHKAETTLANNSVQGSGQDFLKAAIIRSDPLAINPDKAVLARMMLKPLHKAYIQDTARKLEKYRRILTLAKTQWLLQVHDESLWRCATSASIEVGQILAEIMTWRHYFPSIRPYTVPLVADGGIADNWKDAKSKHNGCRIHYWPSDF